MAITRIKKWGNSFGLRISKKIMEELELTPDTRLEIHQEEGKIVLIPIEKPKVTLDELLRQITPDNLHVEVDWESPAGKEIW